MSKEPTRAQLSSRLAYHGKMPAFLQKLQKQVNGSGGGGESDEEDDEWEYDGSGRPPIPKRPAIPERPADNPGSADEDDDVDEKPQIVVLREGKHLSEREVENEKRRAKGLLPLSETDGEGKDAPSSSKDTKTSHASTSKPQATGLSFSSGSAPIKANKKRKAVGDGKDDESKGKSKSSKPSKKPKKAEKKLLSFDDEA